MAQTQIREPFQSALTYVMPNGAVATMKLGIEPVLEAMVYIKGLNNQAIQVFETRKLRRYRVPNKFVLKSNAEDILTGLRLNND